MLSLFYLECPIAVILFLSTEPVQNTFAAGRKYRVQLGFVPHHNSYATVRNGYLS